MASNHQVPIIPSDITAVILSNLPIKPLCRLKSVSKPWLAMINHLIKTCPPHKCEKLIIASSTHSRSFYSLNPQSPNEGVKIVKNFSDCLFEIISSCNGVLLLRISYGDIHDLFFWNPLTQRHWLIPSQGTSTGTVIQGFGYDYTRDDFKVIWVVSRIGDDTFWPTRTYVFSSVSRKWKRIDDFEYHMIAVRSGVVFNESPYWIVSRIRGPRVIIYFDPCEEIFQELPNPEEGLNFNKLIVLGENLGGLKGFNSIEVWVMKDSSWTVFFVVPRWQEKFSDHVLMPLCFIKVESDLSYKAVIVQLNSCALALYNINEDKHERIELPQNCERFNAACYVETLASPWSSLGKYDIS